MHRVSRVSISRIIFSFSSRTFTSPERKGKKGFLQGEKGWDSQALKRETGGGRQVRGQSTFRWWKSINLARLNEKNIRVERRIPRNYIVITLLHRVLESVELK